MELDPLKLPGKLSEYTGNVMYPNDESAVWDIKREQGNSLPINDQSLLVQ